MHFRFCWLSLEQHKASKGLGNLKKGAECFHLIKYKSCMHEIHLILTHCSFFFSLQQVTLLTILLWVLSGFGCSVSYWDIFFMCYLAQLKSKQIAVLVFWLAPNTSIVFIFFLSEQVILTTASSPTFLLHGSYIFCMRTSVFTTACSPISHPITTLDQVWQQHSSYLPWLEHWNLPGQKLLK